MYAIYIFCSLRPILREKSSTVRFLKFHFNQSFFCNLAFIVFTETINWLFLVDFFLISFLNYLFTISYSEDTFVMIVYSVFNTIWEFKCVPFFYQSLMICYYNANIQIYHARSGWEQININYNSYGRPFSKGRLWWWSWQLGDFMR